MNCCMFHEGEYKQCPLSLSLKGRKLAKADTEASNLAELDFYKIIEIRTHIYDCIFLEQVRTGENVFCDNPEIQSPNRCQAVGEGGSNAGESPVGSSE